MMNQLAFFIEQKFRQLAIHGEPRLPGYHVSDIASHCKRKAYYDRRFNLPIEGNYDKQWFLTQGTAFHALFESRGKRAFPNDLHEYAMMYNPYIDEGRALQPNEKVLPHPTHFTGTMDALYNMDDEPVVVDYKTHFYNGTLPHLKPVHKLQVEIYAMMLAATGREYPKYGAVIYVDTSRLRDKTELDPIKRRERRGTEVKLFETPGRAATRKISRSVLEAFMKADITGELPERTVQEWMCANYCPHVGRCFHEETIEPLPTPKIPKKETTKPKTKRKTKKSTKSTPKPKAAPKQKVKLKVIC